jgi:[citrate (pro-3S)-lyase] ligase
MPLYKNWQDFDALRNKSKVLVIYGAGFAGDVLLNEYKIIPDYFCDKNAKQIKNVSIIGVGGGDKSVKCLTLKELVYKLDGRDADILVSNINDRNIKDIHKMLNKTKLSENTVIYYYHLHNVFTINALPVDINLLCIHSYKNAIGMILDSDRKKNFNMLKKGCFNNDSLQPDDLIKLKRNYTFKKGRIFLANKAKVGIENIKTSRKQIIYFFCNSKFESVYSKKEGNLEFILSSLLWENNTNYEVLNYSAGGFQNENIIFQLTAIPLARNGIVIITGIDNPYSLAVAKQYCQKYNCRLIYYFIPCVLFRKNFSDWEKLLVEKILLLCKYDHKYKKSEIEILNKQLKLIIKTMGIEFYEPPDEFFNSEKTIYLDYVHFGDYGNEIIAKHLNDIITNKIKPNNFGDFCIEPYEKIKYVNSVIPYIVPDIKIYLNNLEKHRQELGNCGAIVMNCNPFTLGHRYLIEYAMAQVEHLYIFVVEEDKSEFSFKDRFKLVKQNTADLANVTVLPSGKFIISSLTFDAYFGKSGISEEQAIEQDTSFDLLIFAAAIAPALNIKTRFVGQEPFDPLTRHYNEEMKSLLPEYGCDVVEIPRLEKDGGAVSASRVRKLLKDGNFEEIRKIVPKATLRGLRWWKRM